MTPIHRRARRLRRVVAGGLALLAVALTAAVVYVVQPTWPASASRRTPRRDRDCRCASSPAD